MRSKLIPFIFLGLTPMAANAADLAKNNYARAYPPPSAFNWTGLYVGAHIGYGWRTENKDTYILTTGAFSETDVIKSQGVFGGLHLGYNQQFERIVVGVEGEFSLANITNTTTYLNVAGTQIGAVTTSKDKNLGSIRGRLGYAFDNVLIFGTGGVAFKSHDGTRTQYATAAAVGAAPAFSTNPVFVENSSHTSTGGTIGGGAEVAIDKNWTLTASYMYTKWQNSSGTSPLALASVFSYVAPGVANGRLSNHSGNVTQTIQTGVNYKF